MTAIVAQKQDEILDTLFWGNVDINAMCPIRGLTPLALAAQHGLQDICLLLINRGAAINHEGGNGKTALEATKNPAMFQFLIDRGTEINNQNEKGKTKLMRAAREGNLELCRLLIEAKADLELQTNPRSNTALIMAGGHHQTKICQLLIQAKANIYASNDVEKTALSAVINDPPFVFFNPRPHDIPAITKLILDTSAQLNEDEKRLIMNWFLVYNRLQKEGRGISSKDLKKYIARLIQHSLAQDLYNRAIRAGAAELIKRAQERGIEQLPELVMQVEAHLNLNALKKTVYEQTKACMALNRKTLLQKSVGLRNLQVIMPRTQEDQLQDRVENK